MKSFVFKTIQSIINESDALKNIADICRQQHMSKPLIGSVGLMAKLEEALPAGGIAYSRLYIGGSVQLLPL